MDTEILEVKELVIPKELSEYLENDTETFSKLDEKIGEIASKLNDLSNERLEKEKEFEKKLEEFKTKLEEEIKESNKIFDDREKELNTDKSKVETIKSEQETKKEKYIESLKNISEKYNSKISSIKSAIEACTDNDTLKKALDEEESKLKEDLVAESNNRKEELNNVLNSIGIGVNEVPIIEEVKEEKNDYSEEEYDKFINLLNNEINKYQNEKPEVKEESKVEVLDNEVTSHENRKDVISEIYESEEIMEGQVFPYLKGLLGE